MCRIFGYLDRPAAPAWLHQAGELLRHGGPDGRFMAHGDRWGLGAARLAITDPAGGSQPYRLDPAVGRGRAGTVLVAFNGEIYNHDVLRSRLVRFGYRFDDRCDGSILPALYHRYGMRFMDHLDGMYAIAVLDLRAEPTLILVTDDAGMKPLYYTADRAGGVAFASELTALLALPDTERRVWLDGLDAYLTTKALFGERTMFAGIRVLRPGTVAVYTAAEGLRLRHRPEQPVEVRAPAGRPDGDLAAAGAACRRLLRAETHRLARADVPLAAICSGGLDSSLVTALLAERMPALAAFHLRYRGSWPMDERHFARAVADRCAVRLHEVELDPAALPELLPRVVAALGQPNADPITVSTYVLFGAVHAAGYRVAVTGDAADELFGGYDRFQEVLRAGDNWTGGYLDALAACRTPLRNRLYHADYLAHLRTVGSAADRLAERLTVGDPWDRIRELEIGDRLPAYHLRRVDHLSMASAVEVRLPFCQAAVTRFAAGLPVQARMMPGRPKPVLYAAARQLLPDAVLYRPKQPFTLPLAAMLAPTGALYRYLAEVLTDPGVDKAGQLDGNAVGALLARHASSPNGTTALAIWSLAMYQSWYAEFIGCRRPAATAGAVVA